MITLVEKPLTKNVVSSIEMCRGQTGIITDASCTTDKPWVGSAVIKSERELIILTNSNEAEGIGQVLVHEYIVKLMDFELAVANRSSRCRDI